MRTIISMMFCFFLLPIPLTVIAIKEGDLLVAVHAFISLVIASGLLWHLTRKFRADKRGFWVSVGLLMLSFFTSTDH